MKIVKWGFGSAPLKSHTKCTYMKALHQVDLYISNQPNSEGVDICQEISIVKGLFNRIIKQDQWDWFTVYMYLDYPQSEDLNKFTTLLSLLRKSLVDNNLTEVDIIKRKLAASNFSVYANNFINYKISFVEDDSYVYILSRREEREILKIGMTNRNVIKRCQEINSATGVLFPFSPRAVFRVKDAKLAEKLIHEELRQYRVRSDREFFILPYKLACTKILDCLKKNNLLYYKYV